MDTKNTKEGTKGAKKSDDFDLLPRRVIGCAIEYRGLRIESGFRMDMLVDETIVIELKSVEQVLSDHEAQILNRMRLANKSVGLMINFNQKYLKDGVKRYVL